MFPSIAVLSGWVEINGEYAPKGTIVVAKVSGIQVGNHTITSEGQYGMVIEGTSEDIGKEIEFYINGVKAEQTTEWKPVEEQPILTNLSVTMTTTSSSSTTTTTDTTVSDTSSSTTSSSSTSSTSTISATTTAKEITTTVKETTTILEPSTTLKAETTVIETTLPQKEGNGNEFHLAVAGILAVILIILVGILIMLIKRE